MKKIPFIFFIVFCTTILFPQELSLEQEPSRIEEISSEKTKLVFETSIPDVEVFINGSFYGRSDLEVNNLRQGLYSVELLKKGYKKVSFNVFVRAGFAEYFTVEQEKDLVAVRIQDFFNADQETVEYICMLDGNLIKGERVKQDLLFTVTAGKHNIYLNKFGFMPEEFQILAENTEIDVHYSGEEADFRVSDFIQSTEEFNPEYGKNGGNCVFSFRVSAASDLLLEVKDSKNQSVYEEKLKDIQNWNQSFTWNGLNSEMKTVEDGIYYVLLENSENSLIYNSWQVIVNSCKEIPLFVSGYTGSQAGNVPLIFEGDYKSVFMNGTVNLFAENGFNINSLDFNAGFIWAFKDCFEFYCRAGFLPSVNNGISGRVNCGLKAGWNFELGNKSNSISLSALIRYGYFWSGNTSPTATFSSLPSDLSGSALSSNEKAGLLCSKDYGNGIGAGLTVSYNWKKVRAGLCSQFVYSAATGNLKFSDMLFSNQVWIYFRPVKNFALSGWGGVNSLFNNIQAYKALGFYEKSFSAVDYDFAGCIEGGISISCFLFNSFIITDFQTVFDYIKTEGFFVSCKFGLSYLF